MDRQIRKTDGQADTRGLTCSALVCPERNAQQTRQLMCSGSPTKPVRFSSALAVTAAEDDRFPGRCMTHDPSFSARATASCVRFCWQLGGGDI